MTWNVICDKVLYMVIFYSTILNVAVESMFSSVFKKQLTYSDKIILFAIQRSRS